MHKRQMFFALAVLLVQTQVAWSSDACLQRAVSASADVTVSDGSSFRIESLFRDRQTAAIRHLDGRDQTVAVEGPIGWIRVGDQAQTGDAMPKQFALGHQYHAFILYFDELVDSPRDTASIGFLDAERSGRSGDLPYGGTVHLVDGPHPDQPSGLLFELPQQAPISVTFGDWRQLGDHRLPYLARINDGERVFDYRYTDIDLSRRSPLWFQDAIAAPDLDRLRVYRLHRQLLIAHCLGDTERMAELSTDETLSANAGELTVITRDMIRSRFAGLFEQVNYTEYHDLVAPVINVADSADQGWLAVNVRAVGSSGQNADPFDLQWAWIMIVRKVDGRWLHAGNASNVAR